MTILEKFSEYNERRPGIIYAGLFVAGLAAYGLSTDQHFGAVAQKALEGLGDAVFVSSALRLVMLGVENRKLEVERIKNGTEEIDRQGHQHIIIAGNGHKFAEQVMTVYRDTTIPFLSDAKFADSLLQSVRVDDSYHKIVGVKAGNRQKSAIYLSLSMGPGETISSDEVIAGGRWKINSSNLLKDKLGRSRLITFGIQGNLIECLLQLDGATGVSAHENMLIHDKLKEACASRRIEQSHDVQVRFAPSYRMVNMPGSKITAREVSSRHLWEEWVTQLDKSPGRSMVWLDPSAMLAESIRSEIDRVNGKPRGSVHCGKGVELYTTIPNLQEISFLSHFALTPLKDAFSALELWGQRHVLIVLGVNDDETIQLVKNLIPKMTGVKKNLVIGIVNTEQAAVNLRNLHSGVESIALNTMMFKYLQQIESLVKDGKSAGEIQSLFDESLHHQDILNAMIDEDKKRTQERLAKELKEKSNI